MISHFWLVTGRLIEYLQPSKETFSRNTSQLMFTCSLRPYAWVYEWVCRCVCVCECGWNSVSCLCECLSVICFMSVKDRVTRVSRSHGTIVEVTFCQWHSHKCPPLASSFSRAPSLHFTLISSLPHLFLCLCLSFKVGHIQQLYLSENFTMCMYCKIIRHITFHVTCLHAHAQILIYIWLAN